MQYGRDKPELSENPRHVVRKNAKAGRPTMIVISILDSKTRDTSDTVQSVRFDLLPHQRQALCKYKMHSLTQGVPSVTA